MVALGKDVEVTKKINRTGTVYKNCQFDLFTLYCLLFPACERQLGASQKSGGGTSYVCILTGKVP